MRELSWPACWNVRDLGGVLTMSGRATAVRRVVRAGNLSRLTEAGRDAVLAYGIRTVIDVRDPREHAMEVDPFHPRGAWAGRLGYVSEPLISEAEWSAIRDPEQLRRGYVLTLELSKEHIGRVMAAIAEAPEGGVVIHCHAGKERTGVVAALLLALAGCPAESIADDYVASDAQLTHLYDDWAAREPEADARVRLRNTFVSKAEHILRPLELIDAQGGIESYLRSSGLADETIARLRSRILA
jgi:protein-tyrosine phosphatase